MPDSKLGIFFLGNTNRIFVPQFFKMSKKRVLSCIQPTGDMHYGNYFGAVKNWVDMQSELECFYGVVDYHAMTMPYNVKKLRNNTWDLIFNLLAVGVEPENLFIQSLVPEHAELGWIFNNFAAMGRVENMTQFKDKSLQSKSGKEGFISVGLFDYPVLQAADILIYKADFVPVGKDQSQHLELTREIAQRFNNQVGKEYFVLPETKYTATPKIMSTADPLRKMSKSAGEKHYINVFADDQRIRKQIKSAVTSSEEKMSAGVKNLLELLSACGHHDQTKELTQAEMEGTLRYADLKEVVADALIEKSSAFRAKREELLENKKAVKDQIKVSSMRIRKVAQQTVSEVKELVGLLNVKF